MDKAVTAVVNEGLSIRRAALQYGVPKSSLGDRISGRVKPGAVAKWPSEVPINRGGERVS